MPFQDVTTTSIGNTVYIRIDFGDRDQFVVPDIRFNSPVGNPYDSQVSTGENYEGELGINFQGTGVGYYGDFYEQATAGPNASANAF